MNDGDASSLLQDLQCRQIDGQKTVEDFRPRAEPKVDPRPK